MTGIRDRLRRSGRLVGLYRGIRAFVLGPPAVGSRPARAEIIEDRVRELRRVEPRISPIDDYRLNLLIPTVASGQTFGGIRTALDLFEAVAAGAPASRVVTMAALPADGASAIRGYRATALSDDVDDPRQLVSIESAPNGRLAVGPRDVFIATFWPTADLAVRLRRWQATEFGAAPARWAYVIQDFEPGFYPMSAQSELARATYSQPDTTVAIFNTGLLQQAFHEQAIRFDHEFVLEPRLTGPLREALSMPHVPRSRTIVVYGRPRTPRNAFPAVVDALRVWQACFPGAASWTLVSAGQPHPDIHLGEGVTLRSLGKLDLPEYGRLLRQSAIGISLMISPHPSYPPLEMAHLGMLVLTNRFGNKDLSASHSNITSTGDLSAEALAGRLAELCDRFEADPETGRLGRSNMPDYLSDRAQFPFASDLADLLLRGAVPGPP